jgi:cysteine desulfurase
MPEPSFEPERLYFDHAATTPVRGEVGEAMAPFLGAEFGNPSSLHSEGRRAREALEEARESIRRRLRADDFDLVFTSGGTEADHAAVLGCVLAAAELRPGRSAAGLNVVASAVEHAAVLGTEELLGRLGVRLVRVPVDGKCRIDLDALDDAVDSGTCLVSVMAANNETGVVQLLEAAGRLAREKGIPFHTDAVQVLGKREIDLGTLPADLVSISAHKVYGPKAVGALLVRRGLRFAPVQRGGQQEGGLRAGTENVAGAVGFARAVELAEDERPEEALRLCALQNDLRERIGASVLGVVVFNTPEDGVLPHILNVSFPQVEGESLVKELDRFGVAVSTGSACASAARKPSHVLRAMGRSEREVRGSIRFSLGRGNREEQLPLLMSRLGAAVERLAALAPAS